MALTTAERQKRFRERLKAKANGSLYDAFVRERRETILEWLKEHKSGEPLHAILTAMLESPDGGMDAETLSIWFRGFVNSYVIRERNKATPRKRRTRAEIEADTERRKAERAEAWAAILDGPSINHGPDA
jgi:hypothetical protein